MASAVAVENLEKTYRSGLLGRDRVTALQDVSLQVAPGEIFGLLGPNGAGKTTLVKSLLGLVTPTRGEARLLGQPTHAPAARQRVGYLPENHRFPEFLTTEKMLDLYGQVGGVDAATRRRRIAELLERVGLADHRTAKIGTFSKGMRQRAGLAQALLGDPDVLFLDEPTDGVDPVGRREIRDLILWLRDQGTTVFVNSHLLSEVEQVCARVAILNEGRLVREGPLEALTAAEHVYELVATPIPEGARTQLGDVLGTAGEMPPDPAADLHRYHLRPRDRAHLNAVLDALREAGVQLDALRPVRRTLEEYFIDVVEQDRRARRPAG